MGRWHATCWKSRTRRHDGLGHRHPQATRGRRAARNPAPAAGSRLLWADTIYQLQRQRLAIKEFYGEEVQHGGLLISQRTKLSDKVIEMFNSNGVSIKRAELFEGEIKAIIDVGK